MNGIPAFGFYTKSANLSTPPTGPGRVTRALYGPLSTRDDLLLVETDKNLVYSPRGPRPVADFRSLKFRKSFLDGQSLAHLKIPNAALCVHDVFTMAGMYAKSYPDLAARRRHIGSLLRSYPLILAPSEFTRGELERMGVARDRIRVAYDDCDRSVFRPRMVDKGAWLESKGFTRDHRLLLHVSYGSQRKNLRGILGAFKLLSRRRPEIVLALGGRSAAIAAPAVDQLGLRDGVIYLEKGTDEDLAMWYNMADCFVFPSLAEGFGLPVLEAQACGCPVVTSNTTALKEIAGPLCRTVDPRQTEAIAEAIQLILMDTGFRGRKREGNAAWSRRFSWEPAQKIVRDWLS